jgi:hypothetical protein
MSNTLLTVNMITRRAVMLFKNSNAFIQNLDRQYDDQYAVEGAKIGDTLRIRLPNDYVVADGPALSVQDTSEQNTTLTVAYQRHIDIGFTSKERTLSLDDFEERILAPMMNNLVGNVAAQVMSNVEGGYNGLPGVCNMVVNQDGSGNTIAPTSSTILLAGAALSNNSAQTYDRKLVVSPNTMAKTIDTLKGLFNPVGDISKQYRTAQMYSALNFKWFEDQTVLSHTTGTFSAGTVNGAGQTGNTLVVNAITGTLKKGDIITIANTGAVNYVNKQSTGALRQFVLLADAANGATSLSIYPAIIPGSGSYDPTTGNGGVQYQTVTVSPANSAAISLVNKASETYRKNIAYAPQAITMVTADLYTPNKGVVESARAVYDKTAMRMLTSYVPGTDQTVTRLDVLFGSTMTRPQWAVIVPDTVT